MSDNPVLYKVTIDPTITTYELALILQASYPGNSMFVAVSNYDSLPPECKAKLVPVYDKSE